jgi:RNA polymerase sigma-70 factor (ECF subfamily)
LESKYTPFDDRNFEEIYLNYFPRLLRFAKEYVQAKEDAENITQDVFMTLWERRDDLKIHINTVSYLFILMKNRCIDHLRRKKHAEAGKTQMQENFTHEQQMKLYSLEAFDQALTSDNNIEEIITRAIDALPPRCREIFILNKMEGKKYREIADELHISVSTVENQMSIAFRKLREQLKDYMLIFFFLIYL